MSWLSAKRLKSIGLHLLACALLGAATVAMAADVRVAVLAFRPKAETLAQWQPTADFLSRTLAGQRFTMVPMNYDEIGRAIDAREVDFVLTNPSHYIVEMRHHGLNRIATVIAEENGQKVSAFGGVIVTRADRTDIRELRDLRGKTIATPGIKSLGGYQVQALALLEAGIKMPDQVRLLSTEMPHDRAVDALFQGQADAAFVRTGLLESMTGEGKLHLHQLRVLNIQKVSDFPFALSTHLYPEWPFAVLPHVDNDLSRRVAAALLTMPLKDPAAQAGRYFGWTIPADYEMVRLLLERLRLPPYETPPPFTIADVAQRYLVELVAGMALLSLLGIAVFRLTLVNRKLREQEQRTAESESRYRAAHAETERLLQSAGEGIYGVNLEGRCTFINAAALRMLGVSREEVIGADQHTLFHHSHLDGTPYPHHDCPIARTLHDGEPRQMEEWFIRKGGTGFPVELIITPVKENNLLIGVEVLFQDITARRNAEAALRHLNETLESRVREEVAKNLEKEHMLIQQSRHAVMGEMIGNIAHQWRQPINALGLLLANIKDAYDYDELDQDYLNNAVAKGDHLVQKMSSTIDDFRNFFKPNKTKGSFSLKQMVAEARNILGGSLASHGIQLVESGEEITVVGYANEFSQVLLNVINNAKEAIVQSGVTAGRICVELDTENGFALVRISDNGGGIPAETLPRVFDPYFTTKEKGTGIGLYMTKLILEHMDGFIAVDNIQDGAEFTIKIPLANPK